MHCIKVFICLLVFSVCIFLLFNLHNRKSETVLPEVSTRQNVVNRNVLSRNGIYFDPNIIYAECDNGKDGNVKLDENVDFRIIVLTYNRHLSLQRLLSSINKAHFDDDKVVLDIWMDRPKTGDVDKTTLEVANKFSFGAGIKRICKHSRHVGILGQWLATWKPPKNEKEIVVFLEDDLTVSPYFWKFLKHTHKKYGLESNLNGISLTSPFLKFTPSKRGVSDHFKLDTKHCLFRYSTLGTWGFSPNRLNWFRFVDWFKVKYGNYSYLPLVPHHKTTGWYKGALGAKTEDSVWEMWHIHWAWLNSEYTLYPNFPDGKSFCFNWKEKGLHYNGNDAEKANADIPHLLQEWKNEFNEFQIEPVMLDNNGNIVH